MLKGLATPSTRFPCFGSACVFHAHWEIFKKNKLNCPNNTFYCWIHTYMYVFRCDGKAVNGNCNQNKCCKKHGKYIWRNLLNFKCIQVWWESFCMWYFHFHQNKCCKNHGKYLRMNQKYFTSPLWCKVHYKVVNQCC